MLDVLRNAALLVLAAGASRRWGSGSKLVSPYRGRPMLAHVLDLGSTLGFGLRLVVTGGRHHQEIAEIVAGFPDFTEAFNPDAETGIGSSIATGARRLGDCDGVFICLGDMPNLEVHHIGLLAGDGWNVDDIRRPTYQGEAGHPVLFGRHYFEDLAGLQGDVGASGVIRVNARHLSVIESPDPGVIEDFDTPP